MLRHLAEKLSTISALVCDDDETARTLAFNYLRDLGVARIDTYENGDLAWEALQKQQYQLIVLDWKLPGLSGLALFNRIRQKKNYRDVPLLVMSGFIDKNDFRLLQEIPLTLLIEKPFTKSLFANKLEALLRELEWREQNAALVESLIHAADYDAKKCEKLINEMVRTAPNPIPLAVLAARKLVRQGLLKPAQRVLEAVQAVDDSSVIVMNELGKILHLAGDHRGARDVLRVANRVSPQNMARLCLLGEVELNLQNSEEARAYFDKALEIDADSRKAQAGLVVANNLRAAGNGSVSERVSSSFASILNTIGIGLVRTGQYDRGIEQYKAALPFIHSRDDAARVAFNLGLGLLRWGKPEQALSWFQKSEQLSPDGFKKSTHYVERLLAGGTPKVKDLPMERELSGANVAAAPPGESVSAADKGAGSGNVIPFPPRSGEMAEQPEERVGGEKLAGGDQDADGELDAAVESLVAL